MIPLYSSKVVRKVDDFAIKKLGYPSIILMENASLEVFRITNEEFKLDTSKRIGIICGKGNNGGDGFATARHFLNNGYTVFVLSLYNSKEMTSDCKTNHDVLKRIIKDHKPSKIVYYSSLRDLTPLKKCALIVDAMLGTGIEGTLKEPFKAIVNKTNSYNCLKLSIDVPTGLNSDTGDSTSQFNADLTVTLGELKPGLYIGEGYSQGGKKIKGSIGLSPEYYKREQATAWLIEKKDLLNALPKRSKSVHKYSAGKVLSIAGSGKYPGAAVLTAKSSLSVGAGASILAFPKSVRSFIHKKLDEVVLTAYEDGGTEFLGKSNLKYLNEKLKWADVVALGPGLGREYDTILAIREILKERKFKNIVIDADGLYAISDKTYTDVNLNGCILTPHHNEFCGLIGIKIEDFRKNILQIGKNFAKKTGSYLVLKGAPTIIFFPNGKILINTTGNPGMAKFGTGDVLTGVIAGFLSQSHDIQNALISGVYIHSFAADILAKSRTELGFMAHDLINILPSALRQIKS